MQTQLLTPAQSYRPLTKEPQNLGLEEHLTREESLLQYPC